MANASRSRTGFGALAWTGRRLVSKFDAMDKAVRGNGAAHPGLGEQIRSVHAEVRLVRSDLAEHVDGEPARVERMVRRMKGYDGPPGSSP